MPVIAFSVLHGREIGQAAAADLAGNSGEAHRRGRTVPSLANQHDVEPMWSRPGGRMSAAARKCVWHPTGPMPGRTNPSRVRLDAFIRSAAASLPDGARGLDAGAGDCRYRVHFDLAHYQSADFLQVDKKNYAHVDYVCSLESIPVEAQRYELVLLTQVLVS
jgi:hypothetical protein